MTYDVHANDGDLGHVEGMLVDDETWAIRYLIVNTSNWWVGHQVLIAPQWIEDISWLEATVSVNLSREAIQHAPAYDPDAALDREQEIRMHEHYGRRGYWADHTGQEGKPAPGKVRVAGSLPVSLAGEKAGHL